MTLSAFLVFCSIIGKYKNDHVQQGRTDLELFISIWHILSNNTKKHHHTMLVCIKSHKFFGVFLFVPKCTSTCRMPNIVYDLHWNNLWNLNWHWNIESLLVYFENISLLLHLSFVVFLTPCCWTARPKNHWRYWKHGNQSHWICKSQFTDTQLYVVIDVYNKKINIWFRWKNNYTNNKNIFLLNCTCI